MAFIGSWRAWRAWFVGSALAVAAGQACAPDITFVPSKSVGHCGNNALDAANGETDIDCGGPDCHACTLGQACSLSTDCEEGECLLGFCKETGCTNQVKDGSETGIDCGGDCDPCAAGQSCSTGSDCESSSCKAMRCASPACDDKVLNGQETSRDCGGPTCDGCPIDAHCELDTDCISGACDQGTSKCVLSCRPNTDDCDGDYTVECETNLLTNVHNCGMCGKNCTLPHAAVTCVGGSCQIESCTAPWDRCDTDETNGCETNLKMDYKNCGACGMECVAVNGKPSCVDGTCQVACLDDFVDCDKNPDNGCETSRGDVDNCGDCKQKCPDVDGETSWCKDGSCGSSPCKSGKGNCNADPNDECKYDLDTDAKNCGRCGHVCNASHGTPACVDGKCVIDQCDSGWDNCNAKDDDGGVSDGCEANLLDSADNCGGCGTSCGVGNGSGTCQSGACAVVSCDPGFKNCDTDAADGGFKNGCETDTTSDAKNCGGCANVCMGMNAVMKCVDSECSLAGCTQNYDDCTAADGCETDISSSIQHCGSCTGTCSTAGATDAACVDRACAPPVCDLTHLNCDGDHSNGCEATLGTPQSCNACPNDPNDAGACGAGTPNCISTGAGFACQAQITLAGAVVSGQAAASSLTLSHTPASGTNRLIFLAIAAESQNNGIAGARPDSVTYGGVAMTLGAEQAGVNDYWSPDLFIYYLPEALLAGKSGAQSVVISGSTAPAETAIVANVFQLSGVDQGAPIALKSGGTVGSPDPGDPAVIGPTMAVAIPGSRIYGLTSAYWMNSVACPIGMTTTGCPTFTVSPATDLTASVTLSSPELNIPGNALMRAFGAFVDAGSASLPAPGNYVPRWSIPYAGRMTGLSVVISPAVQ